MTRFARAKGSKSCNERLPNDATPWCVMKQQLVENLSKKQESSERTKSAKELLENADKVNAGSYSNVSMSWAEFPENSNNSPKKKSNKKKEGNKVQKDGPKREECLENMGKAKKKTKSKKGSVNENGGSMPEIKSKKGNINENGGSMPETKSKKKSVNENGDSVPVTKSKKRNVEEIGDSVVKSKKRNVEETADFAPKTKSNKRNVEETADFIPITKSNKRNVEETADFTPKTKSNKRNVEETADFTPKTKSNKRNVEKTEATKPEANSIKRSINGAEDSVPETKAKKQKLQKTENPEGIPSEVKPDSNITKNKTEDGNPSENNHTWTRTSNFNNRFNKDYPRERFPNNFQNKYKPRRFDNQKPGKIRDDKVHQRRKPDPGSTKMMINGMEVEVVKYEGFPVRKEDAERLRELKQTMIMKGIPKKDVDAAMKLERRKAEKALARIRRCVCFHCRKAGHNLSDCPELGPGREATGICFKCGSTEHTHFECRVSKPTEFRYATCFICREQGHIAKQCPDNPKGIYPQGGGCKVCGDVTHLKKDCPDLIKEKEETAITLDTIADGNLESLEDNSKSVQVEQKKTKKVVKF